MSKFIIDTEEATCFPFTALYVDDDMEKAIIDRFLEVCDKSDLPEMLIDELKEEFHEELLDDLNTSIQSYLDELEMAIDEAQSELRNAANAIECGFDVHDYV